MIALGIEAACDVGVGWPLDAQALARVGKATVWPTRATPRVLVNSLSGVNGFASRGQLKESAKILGGFNAHDEALQLLALILADHIAA